MVQYKKIIFRATADKKYSFTKIVVIKTSADDFESKNTDISYNDAKAAHIDAWQKIWDMSCIKIDGDEKTERNINYSILHSTAFRQENENKNTFRTVGKRC